MQRPCVLHIYTSSSVNRSMAAMSNCLAVVIELISMAWARYDGLGVIKYHRPSVYYRGEHEFRCVFLFRSFVKNGVNKTLLI